VVKKILLVAISLVLLAICIIFDYQTKEVEETTQASTTKGNEELYE
jgi:hypothetical protein